MVLVDRAGNVGLQPTMSLGPLMPDGVNLAYGRWASWPPSPAMCGTLSDRPLGDAGIVAPPPIDVVGATVATFLIGELGLIDVPAVIVVITAVGLEPLGSSLGSTIAGWRASAG